MVVRQVVHEVTHDAPDDHARKQLGRPQRVERYPHLVVPRGRGTRARVREGEVGKERHDGLASRVLFL